MTGRQAFTVIVGMALLSTGETGRDRPIEPNKCQKDKISGEYDDGLTPDQFSFLRRGKEGGVSGINILKNLPS